MGLRKGKKPQLLYYSISCVILVVFIGLREGVGTDFYSIYVAGFNEVIETGESRFEPGFTLLIHLCAWLTKDYHLFVFSFFCSYDRFILSCDISVFGERAALIVYIAVRWFPLLFGERYQTNDCSRNYTERRWGFARSEGVDLRSIYISCGDVSC